MRQNLGFDTGKRLQRRWLNRRSYTKERRRPTGIKLKICSVGVTSACRLRLSSLFENPCVFNASPTVAQVDGTSDVRFEARTSLVSYQQEPSQPRDYHLVVFHEAQMDSTLGLAEVMLVLPWFSTLRVQIKLMAHQQPCNRTLYCSCRASKFNAR